MRQPVQQRDNHRDHRDHRGESPIFARCPRWFTLTLHESSQPLAF